MHYNRWDLKMDIDNKIILSCAPLWAHPDGSRKIPWRDHWMQAIYYLPKEIDVREGEEINLISCHDEFSLWFNLRSDLKISDSDYERPLCSCNAHVALSRTRIGQLNDGTRAKKWLTILTENVTKESTVLVLSHSCYVALAAAKLGAKKVYILENNILLKRLLRDYVDANGFRNVEVVDNVQDVSENLKEVDVVFSEPYFTTSILPWDNLLFAYLLKDVTQYLREDVKIFPNKAVVKAVAVDFENLFKIRAALGDCQGFSMKTFDDLIEVNSICKLVLG